jgi:hypothetical protein
MKRPTFEMKGDYDYHTESHARLTAGRNIYPALVASSSGPGGIQPVFNTRPHVARTPIHFPKSVCSFEYPVQLPSMAEGPSSFHTTNSLYRVGKSAAPSAVGEMTFRNSIPDDTRMTIPISSRQSSCHSGHGGQPSNRTQFDQNRTCSCPMDENVEGRVTATSTPLVTSAQSTYNIANSASSLPRIPMNNLLDNPPFSDQPMYGTAHSRFRQSPLATESFGTGSLASSTSGTIRPPLTTEEERCCLLNTLYYICVDASFHYIQSLTLATRRRHHQMRHHISFSDTQGGFHPYALPRATRNLERGGRGPGRENRRSESLMDNISAICTHLWRKARHDLIAPHHAEAAAVKRMNDLYGWGEILSRSIDSRDIDEEGVREGFAGWGMATTAKRLCEWLENAKACGEVEEIVRELRELEEREESGGYLEVL